MTLLKIIIVDDEPEELKDLIEFFTLRGFDARGASDGVELDRVLLEHGANLIILDLNLPGEDGVAIANRLKREHEVGILILTSRSRVDEQVLGLTAGADGYLVKGTDLNIIEATARSILRRFSQKDGSAPTSALQPESREGESWLLSVINWTVTAPNNRSVKLTADEKEILSHMFCSPGIIFHRDNLVVALGKPDTEKNRRNLDTTMQRLRDKIKKDIGIPFPLNSVYGKGYVFVDAASIEK
jgi:two-component system, OmpR family, response regulator